MNTKNKFRVWNKAGKRWQKEWQVDCTEDFTGMTFIPEQFTTLVDKKGKEVYEGDILSIMSDPDQGALVGRKFIGEVKFINGTFQCVSKDGDIFTISACFNRDVEIIGNMHESKTTL